MEQAIAGVISALRNDLDTGELVREYRVAEIFSVETERLSMQSSADRTLRISASSGNSLQRLRS